MTNANIISSASIQLNEILARLLAGVEQPKMKEQSHDKEQERLIELLEIQNFPYAPIHCEHQEEKGIGEDCVACQQLQRETYQAQFKLLVEQKGLAHTHTLKAAFEYYNTLITQYRLTECDALLDQIYSTCIERGSFSAFYIMAIQARAFLRFKQGRYQESLDYFDMQIAALGPNERIYENMALAYSRLAQYEKASICYAQAILLIQQKPKEEQEFSTLLLGLSTVLNTEDALVVLEESMKLLKKRFDKPHSLMAKTLSAMGDLYMKKNNIATAHACYEEATRIFLDTCGDDTPLTASAMNKYAKSFLLLDKKVEAVDTYIKALMVWAKVDDESFEVNTVLEELIALNKTTLPKLPDNTITILETLQNKIIDSPILKNDINAICLLKFIYELYILKKDFKRALICCQLFINGLNQVDAESLGEYLSYREQLLKETLLILNILEKM